MNWDIQTQYFLLWQLFLLRAHCGIPCKTASTFKNIDRKYNTDEENYINEKNFLPTSWFQKILSRGTSSACFSAELKPNYKSSRKSTNWPTDKVSGFWKKYFQCTVLPLTGRLCANGFTNLSLGFFIYKMGMLPTLVREIYDIK